MEPLAATEARVLGALLEKDQTTPEYYPLTVNALVNACNQKSSREPVVNYDEATVVGALASLQHKGYVIRVSGEGHRVEKYGHRLGEKLNLGRRELALLSVLMLRGAQTVGELRGRTQRMHDFADLEEVERVLESLRVAEPDPLVAPQARGRWAQLLGGPVSAVAEDCARESAYSSGGRRPLPEDSDSEDHRLADRRLEDRIDALEQEIAELKQQWETFRRQFE
jgi:hypothetical protein